MQQQTAAVARTFDQRAVAGTVIEARSSPHAANRHPVHWGRRAEDRQFLMMERAFNRTGGLTSGDEIARLARQRCEQPISELARWIVTRKVVSFSWQSMTLLPMFQFDLEDMSLNDASQAVIAELVGAYDDWNLACWFARPNPWLDDATPAETVVLDAKAVLEAARADRFIARG